MDWWIWAVAGLVFLIGEVLTPGGIFIIFFGLGAMIVAALELAGVELAFWVQLVLFAVTSLGFLLVFRKPILRRLEQRRPNHEVDSMVGAEVTPQGSIPPGETGAVEYRGTPWKAVNTGAAAVAPGDVCVVTKVDGLRFEIQKKNVG